MTSESGQAVMDCLGIPLILRQIFQCFSTKQLIQLSLVNKQWNYEARSLMQSRGNLTASLDKDQTCQHLGAFATDLRLMKERNKIVPFSGMTISLCWMSSEPNHWCQQLPDTELQAVYEEILTGMSWKHLSVIVLLNLEDLKYCVAFLLVQKILEKFAPVLEEFSIEVDAHAAKHFARECLQHCSFSCLKTFRLLDEMETSDATDPEYTELIRTVVSRAPNLQTFYSTAQVDLHGNLLEGSSAVHMAGYTLYPFCSIPQNLIVNQLRFSSFHLMAVPVLSLKSLSNITTKLLQSSQTTLSWLALDVVFLVFLLGDGICLENLREFTMSVDFDNVTKKQPRIWSLVKSFDFNRTFPKLDTVRIMCTHPGNSRIPDEFDEIIEHGNAVAYIPTPDRAINIKRLQLECLPGGVLRQRSSFQLLAEMFPDVQKLSITGNRFPFAHIEDVWADLKEVDVTLKCNELIPIHLDSAFCGIFPEEVAHLQEQDEEYLRRVNIVPVVPSIAYLKELKTLNVCFARDFEPSRMLSKVSGLVAFQRHPDLTVTLITGDKRLEPALSHLNPYATIVLKDHDYFLVDGEAIFCHWM